MKKLTTICAALVLFGALAGCGGAQKAQKCENLGLYTRTCENEDLHEEESTGRYHEEMEALKAARSGPEGKGVAAPTESTETTPTTTASEQTKTSAGESNEEAVINKRDEETIPRKEAEKAKERTEEHKEEKRKAEGREQQEKDAARSQQEEQEARMAKERTEESTAPGSMNKYPGETCVGPGEQEYKCSAAQKSESSPASRALGR